jgi:predicted kinase
MPQLIIVRGLPGSGKSTFAETNFSSFEHIEADQYFMKNGEYVWNSFKVHSAHSYCYNKVREALYQGKDVVVSNTFTTRNEITNYLEFEYLVADLKIFIFELHTQYGNVHNVPEETIEKMRDRWQRIPVYWKYQPIIIEGSS